MNYVIAMEREEGTVYGVEVPDLPGCFSAGDSLAEAIAGAQEAIAFHLEGLMDAGLPIPAAAPLETWVKEPRLHGRIWAVAAVDLSRLSGRVRRLNITVPERVLRRIDAAAAQAGESRSGFLTRCALAAV